MRRWDKEQVASSVHSHGYCVPTLLAGKRLSDQRGVRVVLLCALVAALVSAQLTFSRDWSAGKRAPPDPHFDCSQFAHICRQFIHDLKASLGKEKFGKHRKADRDLSWDYDDEDK